MRPGGGLVMLLSFAAGFSGDSHYPFSLAESTNLPLKCVSRMVRFTCSASPLDSFAADSVYSACL